MPEVHYLGQRNSFDSDPGSLSKCTVTIVSRNRWESACASTSSLCYWILMKWTIPHKMLVWNQLLQTRLENHASSGFIGIDPILFIFLFIRFYTLNYLFKFLIRRLHKSFYANILAEQGNEHTINALLWKWNIYQISKRQIERANAYWDLTKCQAYNVCSLLIHFPSDLLFKGSSNNTL